VVMERGEDVGVEAPAGTLLGGDDPANATSGIEARSDPGGDELLKFFDLVESFPGRYDGNDHPVGRSEGRQGCQINGWWGVDDDITPNGEGGKDVAECGEYFGVMMQVGEVAGACQHVDAGNRG
jgi:hypothetical protein